MEINQLTALSPVDGRYWNQAGELSEYFSEFALIKYRVRIEIEYFIELSSLSLEGLGKPDPDQIEKIRADEELSKGNDLAQLPRIPA